MMRITAMGALRAATIPAAALAAAVLATAAAPGAAQEQQAFRTLINRGFEIKAVTFAKGEATGERETFVVTLQREKSVAVCYFAATSWINLSGTALDDAKRCDVR